jgi:cyanate permease
LSSQAEGYFKPVFQWSLKMSLENLASALDFITVVFALAIAIWAPRPLRKGVKKFEAKQNKAIKEGNLVWNLFFWGVFVAAAISYALKLKL